MLYNLIAFSTAVATGAADADCVSYYYKINGVCTSIQQFPGATGCGSANGGQDAFNVELDRAFCQEFGTGRDLLDQQVPMVSWGNLGKAGVPRFDGEIDDPSLPSGCITHASQNIYQWNNAVGGASSNWWRPVCMKEPPAPAPSAPPTEPPTDQQFQDCIHPEAPGRCAQRSLKGLGWLTPDEVALEDNFTGTFEECVAHMYAMGQQGAGFVRYTPGQSCVTFVIQMCTGGRTSPAFCPAEATAPPTSHTGFTNVGQGWCQDASGNGFRHYRIEQPGISESQCMTECRNMPECGSINYYPASSICIVDVDHQVSPGTATAPLWTMVSGGQGMHPVTSVDPSPDTVCYAKEAATAPPSTQPSQINVGCNDGEMMKEININVLASSGIVNPSWDPSTTVHGGTLPEGLGWPVDTAAECKALCNAEPRCTAWQTDLPLRDPVWHPQAFCFLSDAADVEAHILDRAGKTIIGVKCGSTSTPPPSSPPTEPPTTCDCRKTTSTFHEGAKCMGPAGETIGYRQTANWCCSDYGCSKGYQWVNPAEDRCKNDGFVGNCMFNFIKAGGCTLAQGQVDDTVFASVAPECFDCDHIGELVDQECMRSTGPLRILSDMIDDARRLSGAPLPAGDNQLEKINRRIAKVRTLLREKKLEAKAALGRPGH